jgi:hypothetical protein
MATDPSARLISVRYDGGYVRATKGAMDKLLGDTDQALQSRSWGPRPGSRRPYGYRHKTVAAAGIPMKATFADGETWTYRVSGPIKNFIDRVLKPERGDEVVMLTSPRGAEVAKEAGLDLDP